MAGGAHWFGLLGLTSIGTALGVASCALGSDDACLDTNAEALVHVCAKSPTLVMGIDVSKWQATIDWSQIKPQGYEFAFIRASDGLNYPDEKFDANWKGAKQNGIVRGAYQFFRPSQDPIAQADLMLAKLAAAGWLEAGDLPPVIDIEVDEGQSDTTIRNRALAWLDYVEQQTGKKPIVYTSAAWSSVLGTALSAYPLWVANYTGTYIGYCPLMPDGWSSWTFWQYTSKGPVAGVGSKDVDKNVFDGTLDALKQFAASGVLPPPTTPPDGGADPCANATSGNGPYCGVTLGGNPSTLYNCQNGATASSTVCANGCSVMPPGQADVCASGGNDPCANASSGNGPYCGKTLGGDPGTLYNCQNGSTAGTTSCANGCVLNPPGVADECAPEPPPPSGSGGSSSSGGSGGSSAGGGGGAAGSASGGGGTTGWSGGSSQNPPDPPNGPGDGC